MAIGKDTPLFSRNVQTGCGAHQPLIQGRSLFGHIEYSGQTVTLTIHPPLAPRLLHERMSNSIAPTCFHGTLPSYLYTINQTVPCFCEVRTEHFNTMQGNFN